jgi:hypothetical protein
VLALLDSIPHGIIEASLVLTYQFDRATIAGLVQEGLATAEREILAGSERTIIEVVRIRITDAGRRALESGSSASRRQIDPTFPRLALALFV